MSRAEAGSTRRPSARWADADRRAMAAALIVAVGAVAMRVAMAPQFDGLDDLGYLEAAKRVSQGDSLEGLFPLFRTRVGMAYPLGWLLQAGWLVPAQFWILMMLAECVTLASLFVAGWLLAGSSSAGLAAAALYALYPLAVQQSAVFYPTAFQVAAIAAACAFMAGAERASAARARLAFGLAAGVSLGVGYLVKEDVAIVVPAVAVASLLTGYPRRATMAAVLAGAAAVFGAECAGYWITTGHPLFRLAATSGLALAPQDQLQIAEIWRWDAFLRSLFLLPVQVGLYWWLGIPAVWVAWRCPDARPRFVVAVFLILALYLQFGSGSLTSYAPLPKTPRYTALVTPWLMLLLGAWVARQLQQRRRALVMVVATVMAAAAIPSIAYLGVSSGERTRNTLAVLPALRDAAPEQLFTDYYGARILRLLQPDLPCINVWYHARFDTNQIVVTADPAAAADAYVLLDRQAAKIYTSSYEMTLPREVDEPPAEWQLVWRGRAFEEGSLTRALLEGARSAASWLPNGNPLSSRVTRNIADMIDGDQAMLYRVPLLNGKSDRRR